LLWSERDSPLLYLTKLTHSQLALTCLMTALWISIFFYCICLQIPLWTQHSQLTNSYSKDKEVFTASLPSFYSNILCWYVCCRLEKRLPISIASLRKKHRECIYRLWRNSTALTPQFFQTKWREPSSFSPLSTSSH